MSFKDHFSGHSTEYALHRPTYPAELFDYLASLAPSRDLAWDCGTGSGQAAAELALRFRLVVATDPSENQIRHASPAANIEYSVAAEEAPLDSGTADLVTVAQAFHWFDIPRFNAEARRVSKPGGVVAVWCYNLTRVSSEVDVVLDRFYNKLVGEYWPPERRFVEEGYASLPFPFKEIRPPEFHMVRTWGLTDLVNYMGTWSATRRYIKAQGRDPIALIADELKAAWGEIERRRVEWPLTLRVGSVD